MSTLKAGRKDIVLQELGELAADSAGVPLGL